MGQRGRAQGGEPPRTRPRPPPPTPASIILGLLGKGPRYSMVVLNVKGVGAGTLERDFNQLIADKKLHPIVAGTFPLDKTGRVRGRDGEGCAWAGGTARPRHAGLAALQAHPTPFPRSSPTPALREAMDLLAEGHTRGKLVIKVADE